MAVEMFQGEYISADSAMNYIDYQTISDGCRMLNDAADQLARIAKKIEELKKSCNKDTLSVKGQSMEETIDFYEKNTNDFSVYIYELSETLMETAERVLNRRQIVLNESAKIEDEKEIEIHDRRYEEEPKYEEYEVVAETNGSIKSE